MSAAPAMNEGPATTKNQTRQHPPDEAHARVSWSQIIEPGDADAGVLIDRHGAREAWSLVRRGAAALTAEAPAGEAARWRKAAARWSPRLTGVDVDRQWVRARRCGATLLLPGDPEWPVGLDDLQESRPVLLWVRGDTDALATAPLVAIVGARAATGYGEHITAEIAGELAARGIAIVSGAAYGIDGAAHRATLACDGTTVAVLAGGADRVYPAGHAALIADISRAGAVVSEVPLGSEPTKWRFLARNRLIAAMTDATLVVEAGWRSGSLNTAGHAAALGRPLGAVPGPVTSAASSGCHRLLREYDAVCITGADDVVELLPGAAASPPLDHLSVELPEAARLEAVLSTRVARSTEELAARATISVADAEALLGLWTLTGRVERDTAGWRASRKSAGR
ncbi:DNA-processing protein DprA [Microbacterium nymphoidis]|uniref:DNA-processing protein DprA n=1 Tax=Microbacterium nymphoidis TaxID=2898586 RepID=UPI001E5D0AC5|nr:DNA-processing protein DprA [Microbacterium nymphoidis]MCD2497154.1 DNA-processing protein DprA [Microbacterium nymphoidis]